MTTLKSNWKEFDKEILRLENAPEKAKFYLDRVLVSGFKATQGAVHVITGSLKSSGLVSSEMKGDDWHGSITYGGLSLGINNPVTYAIYEKRREEDHDFMLPLKALDALYIKAILKVLS